MVYFTPAGVIVIGLSNQERRMDFQILTALLLPLLCQSQSLPTTAADTRLVVVGPSRPVCAIVGEDTLFSCQLKPEMNAEDLEVAWRTHSGAALVHMYRHRKDYDDKPLEQFRGRTRVIRTDITRGAVGLVISNITRDDEADYTCSFDHDTLPIHGLAEFDLKVAGKSACELEKELDTLQKRIDTLQKDKDTLQKDKDDLQKQRDALQKDKDYLIKERETLLENIILDVLQKAKVLVTLDPDTAAPWLILSEGQRRVTDTGTAQPLPDNPRRFTFYACVLGSDRFTSGRHYWELPLLQEEGWWEVGVAAESVPRKEQITCSPEGGVLALYRGPNGQYKACTSPETPLSPRERHQKLGVYLDYEGGRLSLYNAESMEHLYTFTNASFTHRIFPFFCLWDGSDLRLV